MKKKEILLLNEALKSVGNLSGVQFAYGISRNINILKPEIESLQKAFEPSADFNEYDIKRVELAQKYASKDEKGEFITTLNPNTRNREYVLSDEDSFNKEFDVLQSKYKEAIEARKIQTDEYKKLIEEDVEVIPYKIKLDKVPENITSQQLSGIYFVIEE